MAAVFIVLMLVPPEHPAGATALTGTALLLGMTMGTALGAALVAVVGLATTFG